MIYRFAEAERHPGRLTEVTVDCRLLPGQTQAGVEPMLRAWLRRGRRRARLGRRHRAARARRWTPRCGPRPRPSSPRSSPERASRRSASRASPTATAARGVRHGRLRLLPRQVPCRPDLAAARLVHSADERADVDDLEFGVRFLRRAAQAIGTTGSMVPSTSCRPAARSGLASRRNGRRRAGSGRIGGQDDVVDVAFVFLVESPAAGHDTVSRGPSSTRHPSAACSSGTP